MRGEIGINNPLKAVTNLLYLLRNRVQQDEAARGYIGLAEHQLQRISGITKQTLRWSEESVREAGYGSAGALFRDVLQLFVGKIRNRKVDVVIEGGEDVRFYGVINQLAQVMANVVANAIEAMPVERKLWLGAKSDGYMMEIVIGAWHKRKRRYVTFSSLSIHQRGSWKWIRPLYIQRDHRATWKKLKGFESGRSRD